MEGERSFDLSKAFYILKSSSVPNSDLFLQVEEAQKARGRTQDVVG